MFGGGKKDIDYMEEVCEYVSMNCTCVCIEDVMENYPIRNKVWQFDGTTFMVEISVLEHDRKMKGNKWLTDPWNRDIELSDKCDGQYDNEELNHWKFGTSVCSFPVQLIIFNT